MRYLATFVFGLWSFVFSFSSVVSAQEINSIGSYQAADQIIVKYKDGHSSEDLILAIQEKKKVDGEGIFSSLKTLFLTIGQKINGQETPERKLFRIIEAEQKAGVVVKQELFAEDETLNNFFQMKLDSPSNLKSALEIFRSLPEVEFAEPNWLAGGEYK